MKIAIRPFELRCALLPNLQSILRARMRKIGQGATIHAMVDGSSGRALLVANPVAGFRSRASHGPLDAM
jgi:hypothetical protein